MVYTVCSIPFPLIVCMFIQSNFLSLSSRLLLFCLFSTSGMDMQIRAMV